MKKFTLLELVLAVGLVLVVSNFLLQVFLGTLDLSQHQAGTYRIYSQALSVLNQVETDISGMITRNNRNTDNDIRLYGTYIDKDDAQAANGWHKSTFVTSFPEALINDTLRTDMLSNETGNLYDGFISNTSGFVASGDMKEVSYFVGPKNRSGSVSSGGIDGDYLQIYRAVLSPIGSASSLFGFGNATLHDSQRIIAENVIHFGFRYMHDANSNGVLLMTECNNGDWDSNDTSTYPERFPHFIEVQIAFVAPNSSSQQEGKVTSNSLTISTEYSSVANFDGSLSSGTTVTVSLKGTNYKYSKFGYMLVANAGVLYYQDNNTTDKSRSRTFSCVKVDGSPNVTVGNNNNVIFATSFRRVFEVGI